MYDAVVGRMLSADRYVQDATNSQAYNRYSYVLNNPLKYTDPSGWIRQLSGPDDNARESGDRDSGGGGGGSSFMSSYSEIAGMSSMFAPSSFVANSGTYYNWSTGQYVNNGKEVSYNEVMSYLQQRNLLKSPTSQQIVNALNTFAPNRFGYDLTDLGKGKYILNYVTAHADKDATGGIGYAFHSPIVEYDSRFVNYGPWRKGFNAGVGFVPVAGGLYDMYQGALDGNGWKIGIGAAMLVFDIVTGGEGTAAKNGGKELYNFSAKAASHMENPARYVPLQILDDAIQTTKGFADPRGSQALMHYTEMWKNGQMYNLEVLYHQATNSIWHFKYTTKGIGPLLAIP